MKALTLALNVLAACSALFLGALTANVITARIRYRKRFGK